VDGGSRALPEGTTGLDIEPRLLNIQNKILFNGIISRTADTSARTFEPSSARGHTYPNFINHSAACGPRVLFSPEAVRDDGRSPRKEYN
jgi:hypothetical protein